MRKNSGHPVDALKAILGCSKYCGCTAGRPRLVHWIGESEGCSARRQLLSESDGLANSRTVCALTGFEPVMSVSTPAALGKGSCVIYPV